MSSLRQRLQLALTASILAVLLLFGLGQAWLGERLMHGLIATRLGDEAESLLSAVSWDAEGNLQLLSGKLSSLYQRPFSGHYYLLSDGRQQLRSRSLWEQGLGPDPDGRDLYEAGGPLQQDLLILHRRYRKQGHELQLWLAEDMNPHYAPLQTYYRNFAVATLVVLLLLWWWQRTIIRRGLRPLDEAASAVARLKQGELQRLGESVPEEIAPLVAEVNHLTARLEQSIERSRHALGNLSHALKTPLTLLQQLADHQLWRDYPREYEILQTQLEQIHRRIDEELRRARIVGSSHPAQGFNPAADLPLLVETVKRVHQDKPLLMEFQAPDQMLAGLSRDDMMELLGNLLDNAAKWADTRVRCHVLVDVDAARLVIEDDGPGVKETQQLLSQRGTRLDEQVTGHGLGLAICKEIAEAYGGSLQLCHSTELGGLCVEARLPLAGQSRE
jgi:signal transduction histidine kinase